jgi:hypothetical protein
MLENTEGAIKKGKSRETGNIGHTRRRKTKQKHNIIIYWVEQCCPFVHLICPA